MHIEQFVPPLLLWNDKTASSHPPMLVQYNNHLYSMLKNNKFLGITNLAYKIQEKHEKI